MDRNNPLKNNEKMAKSKLLAAALSELNLEYPAWIVLMDKVEIETFHTCTKGRLARAYLIDQSFRCPKCEAEFPIEGIKNRIPELGILVFCS